MDRVHRAWRMGGEGIAANFQEPAFLLWMGCPVALFFFCPNLVLSLLLPFPQPLQPQSLGFLSSRPTLPFKPLGINPPRSHPQSVQHSFPTPSLSFLLWSISLTDIAAPGARGAPGRRRSAICVAFAFAPLLDFLLDLVARLGDLLHLTVVESFLFRRTFLVLVGV